MLDETLEGKEEHWDAPQALQFWLELELQFHPIIALWY